MGMCLVLTAVSDATLARLHADPPLVWKVLAPDDPEPYAAARAEERPGVGCLGRLLGLGPPDPPPPEVAPLELGPGEGESVDLDKAWHGIHFLLTGTAWEGAPPLDFLAKGGREVGDLEVGYGAARSLTAAEVAAAAAALAGLPDAVLRERYDPKAMAALELYPDIWDRNRPDDDPREYLMESVTVLRGFLDRTRDRGLGLLVHLG